MVGRNSLPPTHKRYMPLHRSRDFASENRILHKYLNHTLWFTNEETGDPYRNYWKKWIVRNKKTNNSKPLHVAPITTNMFVPWSKNGTLLEQVMVSQQKLEKQLQLDWRIKFLEKPGVPMFRKFMKKLPVEQGCSRGTECHLCENNGVGCTMKNIVYTAQCITCKDKENENDDNSVNKKKDSIYVGESSRQVGTRVLEHFENLHKFRQESFIISHWMEMHSLDPTPPVFKFKVDGSFRDALSRQLNEAVRIREVGTLNRRDEFSVNEIIRLEASKYSWQAEEENKQARKSKDLMEQHLSNFIQTMLSVSCMEKDRTKSNRSNTSRLKFKKRSRDMETPDDNGPVAKTLKMDTSTPQNWFEYRPCFGHESPIDVYYESNSNEEVSDQMDKLPEESLKTQVSGGMEELAVALGGKEDKVVEVARSVIATKENVASEASYRSRTMSLPIDLSMMEVLIKPTRFGKRSLSMSDLMEELEKVPWEEEKFKRNTSDTNSVELEDILKDVSEVQELGGENQVEEKFEDDEVDQEQLKLEIKTREKNKLYSIFTKSPARGKRKISPTAQTPQDKSRRILEQQTSASPILRNPPATRPRTSSLSLKVANMNRNKKSGRRRCNTGSGEDLKTQLTLAEVWKNLIDKAKKHDGELDEK